MTDHADDDDVTDEESDSSGLFTVGDMMIKTRECRQQPVRPVDCPAFEITVSNLFLMCLKLVQ